MAEDIIKKLTDKKIELEESLSKEDNLMREASRKVSECQINIVSLRGELKVIEKLLIDLQKNVEKNNSL